MVEYYGARVLFDFTSAAPDELSLRKGESVEVRVDATTDCEEGWLSGSDIHGYHGVFPANYVEDLRTETRAGAKLEYAAFKIVITSLDHDNEQGHVANSVREKGEILCILHKAHSTHSATPVASSKSSYDILCHEKYNGVGCGSGTEEVNFISTTM